MRYIPNNVELEGEVINDEKTKGEISHEQKNSTENT